MPGKMGGMELLRKKEKQGKEIDFWSEYRDCGSSASAVEGLESALQKIKNDCVHIFSNLDEIANLDNSSRPVFRTKKLEVVKFLQ